MDLFNVYPLFDIEPAKALGSKIWDINGTEYLDMYGGHAVISVGHTHPHYVSSIKKQLDNIGFYSNSVKISIQKRLAKKLGELSNLEDYNLFLVNSGAEANENALKLASFHTKRKKILAFSSAFHGRTSAAVAVTNNPKIKALINDDSHVTFVPFNDAEAVRNTLTDEYAAVIMEGIQGVGGIQVATKEFQQAIRETCNKTGALYIHDSVQCGYGRSGNFFSFQDTPYTPDIISMAKGMGNGFPVGGILISPKIEASFGMLGTTFGGNHLSCAAALSVLEIIEDEKLIENATFVGDFLMSELAKFKKIKEIRGKGLMIGIDLKDLDTKTVRAELLHKNKIFTGISGQNTIRLLPSLALSIEEAEQFLAAFGSYVN